MCLNTYQTRPKVAKTSITCWKALRAYQDGPTKYTLRTRPNYKIVSTTDFRLGPQYFGKGKTEYKFGQLKRVVRMERTGRDVNKGFHSYRNKGDALSKLPSDCIVVECVIPKGSLYYEGTNNGQSLGYCSNKIIVVKPA
jgi:hypothetical protein